MNKIIIVGLLWVLYCSLHSIMAATSFKKRIQILFGKNYRYYRLFYNLFAVVTLALILLYQISFTATLIFIPNRITKIAGIAITALGACIMAICITKYFKQESGFLWLNPEASTEKTELYISGIHQFVRH